MLKVSERDTALAMLGRAVSGDPLAPIPGQALGTSTVQVYVRPRRLAFAVDEGDTAAFSRAILAASTIWGGARCPVLFADTTGLVAPAWEEIAECIGIDEIVDLRADRTNQLSFDGAPLSSVGVVSERPVDDGRYWSPHPLAVLDAQRVSALRLTRGAGRGIVGLAALGDVRLAEERDSWIREGATFVDPEDDGELALAQVNDDSVLAATLHQDVDNLIKDPQMLEMGLLVVAASEDDLDSAAWFWNLRALRPRSGREGSSLLITKAMAKDDRVIDAIKRTASASTTPSLGIVAPHVSYQWMAAQLKRWEFQTHTGDKFTWRIFMHEQPISTYTARRLDPRPFWMCERAPGEMRSFQVSWERPTTKVSFASPVTWAHANLDPGHTKLLFDGAQFHVPRSQQTARLFHPNADWDGDRLRLHTVAIDRYEFPIALPAGIDVLVAFLAGQNATTTPSDKAVQITGVINALADPDALCSSTAASVIKALTTSSSRDLMRLPDESRGDADARLSALLAALAPRAGLTFDAIWARTRDGRTKPDVSAALEVLVREGLVHRGLQTDCQQCGLKLFVPFTDVTPRTQCKGCGKEAHLAGSSIGEPGIHYRLGHLGLQLSHNGGVVPLAATRLLIREGSFVMPGANITLGGTSSGEFDLLGWAGKTVFAGEAKSSAAGFSAHDFGKDTARAAALGASEYIVACGETVPDESSAAARSACETSNLKLRVLGPDELFASLA